MKKLKINVDRPQIKSEDISSRQNFDKVLDGYQKLKPPIFKNPWFYGAIGVASLAILLTVGAINSKTATDENKITSSEQQLPEDTKCIHAPIENADVDFNSFLINTNKEETINLPSGTSITIPQGSLISPSNDSKVEIKVREFKSKSESFIAGVPMDTKKGAFESAGMIEIRGEQGGKEVNITPNKPLRVKMNLTKNPTDFEFWKLDETNKTWVNHPVVYTSSKEKNGDVKTNPIEQKSDELHKSIQTLNIDLEKTKNEIGLLKEPNRIDLNLPITDNQRFDLDFDTKEFPELEKFKGMEFEVSTKKAYDKSFTKKTWNDVSLIKENDVYFAVFSAKKDKFKISVRPVLTGQKKEIAEKDFKKTFEEYNKLKAELIESEKQLIVKKNAQQDKYDQLVKSLEGSQFENSNAIKSSEIAISTINGFKADFTVTEFGVYNCDKVNTYPKSFDEDIHFTFSNNQSTEVVSAYVFDEKKDVRYSYGLNSSRPLSSLGVNEKNPNTLLIIDREGKMGYALNFNSTKIKNNQIELALLNKKDQNLNFIQKLINEKTIDN